PVREAFMLLEAEGLVVRKPRRGVFVTIISEKDVAEVYGLKSILYQLGVEMAIKKFSPTEIDQLKKLTEEMWTCVKKEPPDIIAYQEIHRAFHRLILEVAGSTRLTQFISILNQQIRRFSYKSLQNRDHLHSSIRYHEKIVKAIEDKKVGLAKRFTRDHVLAGMEVLLTYLTEDQEDEGSLPKIIGSKS
ncbi:MAG: GntR family transcriptional regulator, partial [Deltaproteobacteria bacterium]|nr:GntR family transcriptional regulator [Deltaproteobacteria bacterium]